MAKYKLPKAEDLLKAGVHFGHQVRRWHPSMEPYIYSVRKNIHIIDLAKTEQGLKDACEFLYNTAKEGKQVIFLGTKKQAADLIKREALRCGALFVNQRWLGGTLTNYRVVKGKIDELVEMRRKREAGEFGMYTKKERLLLDREMEKLDLSVGGLIGLDNRPGAIFLIDVKREKTAIREAKRLNIPVIALIDTNSNPADIDYVIPGNDDALKSIITIMKPLADAVEEGYKDYVAKPSKSEEEKAEKVEKEVEAKKEKKEEKNRPEKKAKKEAKKEDVKAEKVAKKEKVEKKKPAKKTSKKVKSEKASEKKEK